MKGYFRKKQAFLIGKENTESEQEQNLWNYDQYKLLEDGLAK